MAALNALPALQKLKLSYNRCYDKLASASLTELPLDKHPFGVDGVIGNMRYLELWYFDMQKSFPPRWAGLQRSHSCI